VSDAAFRDAARRFEETGAPADRLAWLHARLRVGDLTSRGLRLLAYVGDPEAAQLTEGSLDEVGDLLQDDVLPLAPEDPLDELLARATQTLSAWRERLGEAWRAVRREGARCAGLGRRLPLEELARGGDEVREAGFHVPILFDLALLHLGQVSFTEFLEPVSNDPWASLPTLSPAAQRRNAADPLELNGYWPSQHDVWNEDRVEGDPYRLTVGTSPRSLRHVLAGTVPCLDGRVLDDTEGREGLFFQHLRRAVAGGGFLKPVDC
jgi:hypothetical protein